VFGFTKKKISEIKINLSREEIINRGRILIIDDERPDLIEDLEKARFSVNYVEDITKQNLNLIDQSTFDLIILDFGNVGKSFGADEGLSLLKHIKRVNPSTVVYAYTSKALGTKHADFYVLTDGYLQKDAGIGESTEKIEEGLRKAMSIENLWTGMLNIANIKPGSKEDLELQDLYVRALNKQTKIPALRGKVTSFFSNEEARKIGTTVLTKLLELGIKSVIGG
jgi:DNA-binding response OmpR family regulator